MPAWPEARDPAADLVARGTECLDRPRSFGGGRIGPRPVQAPGNARDRRAGLVRFRAQRDDRIRVAPWHLVDGLRSLLADVDTRFEHHLDGERVDAGALAPGTPHANTVRSQGAREGFRHLA